MSGYTHQAKATREFGIEFRSKLEASWAYALNAMRPAIPWDYVDSPWHDFVLHMPGADWRLEIKPVGNEFVLPAIERMPADETVFVVQGEPGAVEDASVKTAANVLCIWRVSEAFVCSRWDKLECSLLQEMWYATHAWPVRQNEFIRLEKPAEVLRSDAEMKRRVNELRERPRVKAFREQLERERQTLQPPQKFYNPNLD